MNIHALPPIIAALTYLLVALLVYSKKKPGAVNRIFVIMLLCVSLWSGLSFGLSARSRS